MEIIRINVTFCATHFSSVLQYSGLIAMFSQWDGSYSINFNIIQLKTLKYFLHKTLEVYIIFFLFSLIFVATVCGWNICFGLLSIVGGWVAP